MNEASACSPFSVGLTDIAGATLHRLALHGRLVLNRLAQLSRVCCHALLDPVHRCYEWIQRQSKQIHHSSPNECCVELTSLCKQRAKVKHNLFKFIILKQTVKLFDKVLSAGAAKILYTPCLKKNCAFLFLSELRQISTNFNMFW